MGIDAPAFDLVSGCTSFFVPLHFLSMMDAARLPRFVLVVVPETLTCSVDYSDRSAAVLWGDGVAAAVVSATERGRAEILGTGMGSNPSAWEKVTVPRHGFFRQDGKSVQKFAIKAINRALEGVEGTTALHTCFGYAHIVHSRPNGYPFLEELAGVSANQISLESAQQILQFYDSYYSIKYPFGKLDVVAVPDFAAGAMENTGAIFYRETDLLADAKSASAGTRSPTSAAMPSAISTYRRATPESCVTARRSSYTTWAARTAPSSTASASRGTSCWRTAT